MILMKILIWLKVLMTVHNWEWARWNLYISRHIFYVQGKNNGFDCTDQMLNNSVSIICSSLEKNHVLYWNQNFLILLLGPVIKQHNMTRHCFTHAFKPCTVNSQYTEIYIPHSMSPGTCGSIIWMFKNWWNQIIIDDVLMYNATYLNNSIHYS